MILNQFQFYETITRDKWIKRKTNQIYNFVAKHSVDNQMFWEKQLLQTFHCFSNNNRLLHISKLADGKPCYPDFKRKPTHLKAFNENHNKETF